MEWDGKEREGKGKGKERGGKKGNTEALSMVDLYLIFIKDVGEEVMNNLL